MAWGGCCGRWKETVGDGDQQRCDTDEEESGKQGVGGGKELGFRRDQRVHRAHPSEIIDALSVESIQSSPPTKWIPAIPIPRAMAISTEHHGQIPGDPPGETRPAERRMSVVFVHSLIQQQDHLQSQPGSPKARWSADHRLEIAFDPMGPLHHLAVVRDYLLKFHAHPAMKSSALRSRAFP